MIGIIATRFLTGSPETIAVVITGVLAATALLAWTMWRAWKSAERSEKDFTYLRRRLLLWGTIYACSALFGIVEVATGKNPVESLVGLPVALWLVWVFFNSAHKVKAAQRTDHSGEETSVASQSHSQQPLP